MVELPSFRLAKRYTHYIMLTYKISFFAYIVPIGTFALVITFLLEFFIDKWTLFYRSSFKDDFNYEMTRISSKLFMSSVWLYAVGNFIFALAFTVQITWYSIIGLAAATLFVIYLWLLPSRWEFAIIDTFIQYEKPCYDLCTQNNKFEHTYRNQNPATKLSSTTSLHKAENWFMLEQDMPLVKNLRRSNDNLSSNKLQL
jgi:hypothetical protein